MRRQPTWRAFALLWAVLQFALPTLALHADVRLERESRQAIGAHVESGTTDGVPSRASGPVHALPGARSHRHADAGRGAPLHRRRRPSVAHAPDCAAHHGRRHCSRAPQSSANTGLNRARQRAITGASRRAAPRAPSSSNHASLRVPRPDDCVTRVHFTYSSMRIFASCMAALLLVAPVAGAQDDAAARAKARQDSIAKAVKDSIALMKELGGALAAPADSAAVPRRRPRAHPLDRRAVRPIRVCSPISAPSATSCSTSPRRAAPGGQYSSQRP
jgi:hypothetical protein